MLAIADIGFFANMAYTRVQRKILEIRLSVNRELRRSIKRDLNGYVTRLANFYLSPAIAKSISSKGLLTSSIKAIGALSPTRNPNFKIRV